VFSVYTVGMDELLKAINALFEARSNGMVTAEEWENLETAAKAASGWREVSEWRTHDELKN
jgi:hypothetical protein